MVASCGSHFLRFQKLQRTVELVTEDPKVIGADQPLESCWHTARHMDLLTMILDHYQTGCAHRCEWEDFLNKILKRTIHELIVTRVYRCCSFPDFIIYNIIDASVWSTSNLNEEECRGRGAQTSIGQVAPRRPFPGLITSKIRTPQSKIRTPN